MQRMSDMFARWLEESFREGQRRRARSSSSRSTSVSTSASASSSPSYLSSSSSESGSGVHVEEPSQRRNRWRDAEDSVSSQTIAESSVGGDLEAPVAVPEGRSHSPVEESTQSRAREVSPEGGVNVSSSTFFELIPHSSAYQMLDSNDRTLTDSSVVSSSSTVGGDSNPAQSSSEGYSTATEVPAGCDTSPQTSEVNSTSDLVTRNQPSDEVQRSELEWPTDSNGGSSSAQSASHGFNSHADCIRGQGSDVRLDSGKTSENNSTNNRMDSGEEAHNGDLRNLPAKQPTSSEQGSVTCDRASAVTQRVMKRVTQQRADLSEACTSTVGRESSSQEGSFQNDTMETAYRTQRTIISSTSSEQTVGAARARGEAAPNVDTTTRQSDSDDRESFNSDRRAAATCIQRLYRRHKKLKSYDYCENGSESWIPEMTKVFKGHRNARTMVS